MLSTERSMNSVTSMQRDFQNAKRLPWAGDKYPEHRPTHTLMLLDSDFHRDRADAHKIPTTKEDSRRRKMQQERSSKNGRQKPHRCLLQRPKHDPSANRKSQSTPNTLRVRHQTTSAALRTPTCNTNRRPRTQTRHRHRLSRSRFISNICHGRASNSALHNRSRPRTEYAILPVSIGVVGLDHATGRTRREKRVLVGGTASCCCSGAAPAVRVVDGDGTAVCGGAALDGVADAAGVRGCPFLSFF
jgi:hypothetical protein